MAKLRREDVEDIDIKELEDTEYTEADYETYDGDIPPAGTVLTGYVKKMWWTRTQIKDDGSGDDPMIKILWVAAENEGGLEEYNGLTVWETAVLIPGAKFRWAPFINNFGISLKAIKTSTYVADAEDQFGAPIEKIGTFTPGEDSDESWSRIITERHRWNGDWSARAKRWLPYDEEADEEEEAEEAGQRIADEAEEYEEDTEEEEATEEEAEEEAEPEPARGRKARGSRTAAKAPARPAGRTAKAPAGKPAKAAPGRRGARPKADAKPAARTRGRKAAAADDEPPF